jgi:hypothetical protein
MQADKGMCAGDNGSGADQTGVAKHRLDWPRKRLDRRLSRHECVLPCLGPDLAAFVCKGRPCELDKLSATSDENKQIHTHYVI